MVLFYKNNYDVKQITNKYKQGHKATNFFLFVFIGSILYELYESTII